ncbi:hypothetical protein SLE2022_068480 [Rubroshorea leprosula]
MTSKTICYSPFLSITPREASPDFSRVFSRTPVSSFTRFSLVRKSLCFPQRFCVFGEKIRVLNAWSGEGSLQGLDDSPVAVELEPICSESQFDQVIGEAQQLERPVIFVWTASWCRKCIYLKPKLEKLAAEYHPRLRFYCINVNNVPHKVVACAGVTKMPTIQFWKDGKKQAEVIGGHKAYLVVNEVREMIENEYMT